jgi:hypothetical protein
MSNYFKFDQILEKYIKIYNINLILLDFSYNIDSTL